MLSISCEGVAEGLRCQPGSASDAKVAFRAAERAMAAALRIHRRVRDLLDVAPHADMDDAEASTSRVAGQVGQPATMTFLSKTAMWRCRTSTMIRSVGGHSAQMHCCLGRMQMQALHVSMLQIRHEVDSDLKSLTTAYCPADRTRSTGARRNGGSHKCFKWTPSASRRAVHMHGHVEKLGRGLPKGSHQDMTMTAKFCKVELTRRHQLVLTSSFVVAAG